MKSRHFGKGIAAGLLCTFLLAGCSGQQLPSESPVSSAETDSGLLLDGPIRVVRSDKQKVAWAPQFRYEYLGLSFKIDKEFQAGLDDNTLYMQRSAKLVEEGNDIYYAYQYLNFVPEECGDMEYATDWDAWFAGTERIGTVGVFRADYLEEHPIETLTGCPVNTEVGRSGDGQLIYYLSVNDEQHPDLAGLWEKSAVEIFQRTRFEGGSEGYDPFAVEREAGLASLGDFHAQDLDGNPVDKSVFKDYQLTMVNVMTTWCTFCISELPDLNALNHEMQAQGVQVIGIVADTGNGDGVNKETLEVAKELRDASGVEYPMLVPDDVLLNGRLKGINAYPETFFVDSEGNIVGETYSGGKKPEDWKQVIEEILMEKTER